MSHDGAGWPVASFEAPANHAIILLAFKMPFSWEKETGFGLEIREPDFHPLFFVYQKMAAALARVMSVAVPIPALASVSVLQSAAVGGSVVGVVGPL